MTPCEKLLWKRLKGQNIRGAKFRRQHPIEFYIADFYCHEIRLVIEVDGPYHSKTDQKQHDENRSAALERFDIKVIRFTNDEIQNHIGRVMQRIREEVDYRMANRDKF